MRTISIMLGLIAMVATTSASAVSLRHLRDVARCDASSSGIRWSRNWPYATRCSDMRSCEHAYYMLIEQHYFGLDRDADGVPCESVCRSVDDDAAVDTRGCRGSY
jgi:hypothetical protein